MQPFERVLLATNQCRFAPGVSSATIARINGRTGDGLGLQSNASLLSF